MSSSKTDTNKLLLAGALVALVVAFFSGQKAGVIPRGEDQ